MRRSYLRTIIYIEKKNQCSICHSESTELSHSTIKQTSAAGKPGLSHVMYLIWFWRAPAPTCLFAPSNGQLPDPSNRIGMNKLSIFCSIIGSDQNSGLYGVICQVLPYPPGFCQDQDPTAYVHNLVDRTEREEKRQTPARPLTNGIVPERKENDDDAWIVVNQSDFQYITSLISHLGLAFAHGGDKNINIGPTRQGGCRTWSFAHH